jgi:glycine/serine hydroxymethyltransferase
MKETEMSKIANWIDLAITAHNDDSKLKEIKSEVVAFCATYPLYKDLTDFDD